MFGRHTRRGHVSMFHAQVTSAILGTFVGHETTPAMWLPQVPVTCAFNLPINSVQGCMWSHFVSPCKRNPLIYSPSQRDRPLILKHSRQALFFWTSHYQHVRHRYITKRHFFLAVFTFSGEHVTDLKLIKASLCLAVSPPFCHRTVRTS